MSLGRLSAAAVHGSIPCFPDRTFRHSAVFVNTEAGIEKPQDLAGKTLGEFALFGHDAGVWPRGRAQPPLASQASGSVYWPSRRTSKWRCGPVESPVEPTSPTGAPAVTLWPALTWRTDRWL